MYYYVVLVSKIPLCFSINTYENFNVSFLYCVARFVIATTKPTILSYYVNLNKIITVIIVVFTGFFLFLDCETGDQQNYLIRVTFFINEA